MGFSLLRPNTRELWKEWGLPLFVLLSLFLQLILVTLGFRRKSIYRYWIRVVVWTTYLSADSIATLTLGILLNRLANIKEVKGTIDPKSQITAFWAPFLLLHLGGPDTITAYALEDNELCLRQLLRPCVQVALVTPQVLQEWGSTLSILAAGVILVGFIKYAERTCFCFPISYTLKTEEGYRVDFDEVMEVPASEDLSVNSGQAIDKEKDGTLVEAYELFKIFKLLFVGLVLNSGDLEASKRMLVNSPAMDSTMAFGIVEIELGFMYDLLYTKALLLNRAWGIFRWITNLLVLCAVVVFFSLQDRKDYPKVDIYITFLLISAAILLEIYSGLLAISSDWVDHWRLWRPGGSTISSAVSFLRIFPNPRWLNSVAQFNLLKLSIRKRNGIFSKYPWLGESDEKLEKNSYIDYREFKSNIKEWTFRRMREMVAYLEGRSRMESRLTSLELEASEVLKRSNDGHLNWSVNDTEFDQRILSWHIATELCHYKDLNKRQGKSPEDVTNFKMSKLASRYMLYLLVLHPSTLPTGTGVLRYEDTLVDAQKFFEDKLATWAQNLFKKEKQGHTGVKSCKEEHKSTESRDLCEVCHLLLQVGTQLPATKIRGGKSRSVLFDACHLAYQLNDIESKDFSRKWDLIGKVWAKLLIYTAYKSHSYEHSESPSRGGGLISHVWLLMAHLGMAETVQTSEAQCITKLIVSFRPKKKKKN
ncbi:hypothetical protein ACJRO7_005342 [Eucalyptus globulus]|uniref:DUF4220 domain-containing protein n=1 Tax=Eucalyptus globulus TaxID=34317 RepID=A0ABD3IZP6_EUCGL